MFRIQDFSIHYLADKPDFIPACAAWEHGRWGVQKPDYALDHALETFGNSAQRGQIPLTLIALDPKNDLPVAMGSLWENDGPKWAEKTPWIASIYTLYRYRKLGLAKTLIRKLEAEALRLGFDEVYLRSGSAADLYKRLGYQEIETIQTTTTAAGRETLFRKRLG